MQASSLDSSQAAVPVPSGGPRRGAWIWTPADLPAEKQVVAFFRRVFSCAESGRLDISITADSSYTLSIDGQRLCRGPARSHVGAWSVDTHSISLSVGSHCLGVLVHHDGEPNACMVCVRPAWQADIHWRAHGATGLDLSSGPDWHCLPGDAWRCEFPERMSHFGYPEELDLRAYPSGWDSPVYDGSAWRPAEVVAETPDSGPWGMLVPRDIALLNRRAVAPPGPPVAAGTWTAGPAAPMPSGEAAARQRVRATEPPAVLPWVVPDGEAHTGQYLSVDFGCTLSGYVGVQVSSSTPGQLLDILYDECLDPESGAVNPERTYARLADRFRLPGGPCEIRVTHPRGFRYLTVDVGGASQPARIAAVTVEQETYPFREFPVFRCPDTGLNELVHQCARTVCANTADAFMDCPTRERVQWTQDLYIHALVAMDVFGDTAMTRRSLMEGARSQLPDGRINGFFPSGRSNCAFASSSLLWLLLLDEYLLHTGGSAADLEVLLPAAGRVLALVADCCDADGLVGRWPAGQFWSWEPIEQGGTLLLTNAFYAMVLARLPEREALAALVPDSAARLERLRESAQRRFYLPERELYSDGLLPNGTLSPVTSQFANAMAVLAGICPAAGAAALLRRIVDPDRLGPVPVGEHSLKPERDRVPGAPVVPVGTLFSGHWLCRAIFEQGLGSIALDQIRQLWLPYRDAPTLPEVRHQAGNTGFCHGWAAGPAFLLPRYALGLRLEAPHGAVFAPVESDLQEASGAIPNGPEVSWRRRPEGGILAHVSVPEGWRLRIPRPGGDDAEAIIGPAAREVTYG